MFIVERMSECRIGFYGNCWFALWLSLAGGDASLTTNFVGIFGERCGHCNCS